MEKILCAFVLVLTVGCMTPIAHPDDMQVSGASVADDEPTSLDASARAVLRAWVEVQGDLQPGCITDMERYSIDKFTDVHSTETSVMRIKTDQWLHALSWCADGDLDRGHIDVTLWGEGPGVVSVFARALELQEGPQEAPEAQDAGEPTPEGDEGSSDLPAVTSTKCDPEDLPARSDAGLPTSTIVGCDPNSET